METVVSLITARRLLDGDLSPDAISSFVRLTERPFSVLREARDEVADRWQGPLVMPLPAGEIRPWVTKGCHDGTDAPLNLIWAHLIHAHSVAVHDPLESIGAHNHRKGSRQWPWMCSTSWRSSHPSLMQASSCSCRATSFRESPWTFAL